MAPGDKVLTNAPSGPQPPPLDVARTARLAVEIIDAWMQHPSAEFLADPMFESLRRWARGILPGAEIPVAATVAAMDQAGQ
jgi:hypothetical protein